MAWFQNLITSIKNGVNKASDWMKTATATVVSKVKGLSIPDKLASGVAAVVVPVVAFANNVVVKTAQDAGIGTTPNPTTSTATYTGQTAAKTNTPISPYLWAGLGAAALFML